MTAATPADETSSPCQPPRRRGVSRRLRVCVLAITVLGLAIAAPAAWGAVSPSQQWMTSTGPAITGPGGTMSVGFGSTGVTGTVTGVANTSVPCPAGLFSACWPQPDEGFNDPGNLLFGPNIDTYIEPDQPAGLPAITSGANPAGATNVFTWSFNKPVIAPIFHIVNLDGSYLDITGTTTTGAPIALTTLGKNAAMEVTGNRVNSTPQGPSGGGCLPDGGTSPPNPNGSCGSFQLGGASGLVQSFTLDSLDTIAGGDGWTHAVSFPTAPLTKQFSPGTIYQGETSQLTFTIANPANPSQPTLTPLDFTDALPAGVSLANGTVANNGDCGSPSVANAGGGALAAGDTGFRATNITVAAGATCTITINVTSNGVGCHVNGTGNLSTSIANLIPSGSTQLCVLPKADYRVEKSMSPTPFVPGEDATYSLKITNDGPSPAEGVVVSDPLPAGMSFVSASPGCTNNAGTVTCDIGTLAVGASTTRTITVHAASSLDSCPPNTASVSGSTYDPNQANNVDQICPPAERRVDLQITKTESQTLVPAGGQVMYTLVVKNNGPSDASQVKVVDPMATGLTLASAKPSQGSCSTAGGKVSCSLGDLPVGGSAQILVTADVWTTPGDIRNVSTVSAAEKETKYENNQDDAVVTVVAGPEPAPFDLVVKKTASKKRISAGGTVRYTITVTNNGPGTAPAVKVTDTFNRRASVKSVSTTAGSCSKALPISCSLGDIAAGGKVTITVVLQPLVADCHQRNAASATGAGKDTNPANNLSRVDICVSPKLRVVKTVDHSTVRAGGLLHYTIRVTNLARKVTANDVRTCDKLPSGLSFVSSKPKAKLSKGSYCWTAAKLKPRKSVTYRVTVRAVSGADGRLRNVATTSGPDGRALRDPAVVEVLGAQGPTPTPTG